MTTITSEKLKPQIRSEACPHGVEPITPYLDRVPEDKAVLVHCPCCNRQGWRGVKSATPMPCPDCAVEAVLTDDADLTCRPGDFCHRHHSWMCGEGAGECQRGSDR